MLFYSSLLGVDLKIYGDILVEIDEFKYFVSVAPRALKVKSGKDAIIDDSFIYMYDIYEWCLANISGKYKVKIFLYSFEKKEDAILFKLTWG